MINIDQVAADPRSDAFVPTNGQTVFNLTATPRDPADVIMVINELSYSPANFSVLGNVVTWGASFAIQATDSVVIYYYV